MNKTELQRQLDLCMGCGYCRDAYGDEGWLEGLKTKHICPVREILGFDSFTAKGRILLGKAIFEELIALTPTAIDIFYQCTLCGNCEAHCISRGLPFVEADVKVRELVRHFRERIVEENLKIPEPLRKVAENISKSGNVFGEVQNSEIMPYLKSNNKADVCYFAGCMATFRQQQVVEAMDKLASRLEFKIGTLPHEICCGNILFRTGQLKEAKDVMEKNTEVINNLGIKTLITSCPGCLSAFKNEYPKFGFPLNCKIQHISEFLMEVPDLKKDLNNLKVVNVTYHDPCELGRLNKIYDPPRNLLMLVPESKLVEPFRTRINSWCCGAGSGVQAAYPLLSNSIAADRYAELKETGAEFIVTACPNCINALSKNGKVMDLIEFLNQYID